MKKEYAKPDLEIVRFDTVDVIQTSGEGFDSYTEEKDETGDTEIWETDSGEE